MPLQSKWINVERIARTCAWVAAIAIVLACRPVFATTIVLSTHGSNGTDPSVLDATLQLNAIGNVLKVTVTNDTTAPDTFNINQIYFNASSDVLGLNLTSAVGSVDGNNLDFWTLATDASADGFGTYDFALLDGVDGQPSVITPGETQVLNLVITCGANATCDMSDFGREFSVIPPGDTPALAAMKFVSGPNGDSAFGATVPEPSTAMLMAFGLLGLLGLSRRSTGTRA